MAHAELAEPLAPIALDRLAVVASDPEVAAASVRLRHVSDEMPGISRRRAGTGWSYRDPQGRPIRDPALLARIKRLAVPPAWTAVWICSDPNGHIQAVGRDARGRKQYRYHPRWRQVRDEAKYGRMLLFGRILPSIRARVAADLARPGLRREVVLAAVVRLLERTLMRVGNAEYAKANGSFGLTTLRNRHVRVRGRAVFFDFGGKHGIMRHLEIVDRRLSLIVRKCQDLPGQMLFEYLDDAEERHVIGSQDVNDYLREISGEEVTSKDFRTWAATTLAVIALREFPPSEIRSAAKSNVVRAIEAVARTLGNTPAVCRKCYIHPAVVEGYLDGSLLPRLPRPEEDSETDAATGMTRLEAAVLGYLRERLE